MIVRDVWRNAIKTWMGEAVWKEKNDENSQPIFKQLLPKCCVHFLLYEHIPALQWCVNVYISIEKMYRMRTTRLLARYQSHSQVKILCSKVTRSSIYSITSTFDITDIQTNPDLDLPLRGMHPMAWRSLARYSQQDTGNKGWKAEIYTCLVSRF